MSKRISIFIMSVVILSVSALFIGEAAGKKVTITLMRDAAEMTDEVIKNFESKNPEINVNYVENDLTKLMVMMAGGTPPDIFRINGIGLPYWVRKGIVKDITPYLEKTIDMDDLFPNNDLYRFDGITQGKGPYYGLLKDWSFDCMYNYNKIALDEAGIAYPSDDIPLTFEEFSDMINKCVVYKGGKVERYGFGYCMMHFSFIKPPFKKSIHIRIFDIQLFTILCKEPFSFRS